MRIPERKQDFVRKAHHWGRIRSLEKKRFWKHGLLKKVLKTRTGGTFSKKAMSAKKQLDQ